MCGIPQGSILGPLRFSIFLNDIIKSCNLFHVLPYADDITHNTSLEQIKISHPALSSDFALNNELNNISIWLSCNKLSINNSKTEHMVFHMKNKITPTITLSMNRDVLTRVTHFNFLGLIIDNQIWKQHLLHANKISKTVGLLTKLKYTLPSKVLLMIYNSLVYSHLNYCSLMWGMHTIDYSK